MRRCITRQVQIRILKLNYSKTTNIYTMGLCVLYYVENSLYNVKKVGFFYLGWNYTLNFEMQRIPERSMHSFPSTNGVKHGN